MQINIARLGLQTLLHTLLTCRCPVTVEVEKALFRAYLRLGDEEIVDFDAILEIADKNPEKTPVHFLYEFCSYLQDDLSSFTITHNDVIRYFSTTYHLNQMKNLDPMIVNHPASYLVSHMLVPALIAEYGEEPEAEYQIDGHSVRFRNIFVSPELELKEGVHYGIHMGTVVIPLTESQVRMMEGHLNLFGRIPSLAEDVTEVDFTNFQHYGDYRANVIARYKRHFSL